MLDMGYDNLGRVGGDDNVHLSFILSD